MPRCALLSPHRRGFLQKELAAELAARQGQGAPGSRGAEAPEACRSGVTGALPAEQKPEARSPSSADGRETPLQKAEPGSEITLKFIKPPCPQGHQETKPAVPELSKAAWRGHCTPGAARGTSRAPAARAVCVGAFGRGSYGGTPGSPTLPGKGHRRG